MSNVERHKVSVPMNIDSTLDSYRAFEHDAWERAAASYAESFETITALFAQSLIQAAGCTTGARVLDVACGSGLISSLVSSLGAEATGVDFSPAMIAQARRAFPCISFYEADAEDLPFDDGHFDCVLVGFGIHHFPSPPRAIAEAARVLNRGGRLAFSVWSSTDHAILQLPIEAIRLVGTPGAALPVPPRGDINDVQACTELLRAGGFTAIEVRKVAAVATVPSAAALLDLLVKGTARASALISAQPPEVLLAVISALEAALEQYRVGTNFQVPAVAIFSVGTRA